ncbi:MAG: VPLPA-CTERM sorting domain-containing protein [Pseudomonadota bacterium]
MVRTITAAAVAAFSLAGGASAASLTFDVTVVNTVNLSASASQAVASDFNAAQVSAGATVATGTFTGDLMFREDNVPANLDDITIGEFLSLGGTFSGLDAVADLTLSEGGFKTATFFLFEASNIVGEMLTVNHDDGAGIFNGGTAGNNAIDGMLADNDNSGVGGGTAGGPTSEITTIFDFEGGDFELLYVAANGNPSVLEVELSAVPIPAAGFLLLGGIGALGAMRRRQKA